MKAFYYLIVFLSLGLAQQGSLKFDEDFDPSTLKEPEIKLPIIINLDEPLPLKFSPTELDSVIEGFRVQVISTQALDKANAVLSELLPEFGSEIYIIFDSPNYKVRVGNFKSRISAEKARQKIASLGYSAPWVIKTKVNRLPTTNSR